ncbi:MAG: hypothetical protein HY362_00715 [Candidatus Aenigmarchaeota archaeon]|nr:hypothetical protein [Candidatus Aenigmarchaeota archaeon]
MVNEPRYIAFRTNTDKPILGGDILDDVVKGLTTRGLGQNDYKIKDTTTGGFVNPPQVPNPTLPTAKKEEKPMNNPDGSLNFEYLQGRFGGNYVAVAKVGEEERVIAYDSSFVGLSDKLRADRHRGTYEIRKIKPPKNE